MTWNWAFATEEQAKGLGLPERLGGWGLLMAEEEETRWTWAVDAVLLAAIVEREGDVSGWSDRIELKADGWPGDGMTTAEDGEVGAAPMRWTQPD